MRQRNKKSVRFIAAACFFTAAIFILAFYRGVFGDRLQRVFNPAAPDTSRDFVKVLDVGQADSILIYSNGYSLLIDAGLPSSGEDISSELDAAGIKALDAVIITHIHSDHAGGIEYIADRYEIDNLILPEPPYDGEADTEVMSARNSVAENGGNIYTAVQGMNFTIGEFEITVLASYGDMSDENDRSVIVMAKVQDLEFLFTGDAGSKAEEQLLDEHIDVSCDVLKIGHHGSSTATSDEFLAKAAPEYAAISVGEDNIYSHPSEEVVSALKYRGAEIFRTDTDGDITFLIENGEIVTETEKTEE